MINKNYLLVAILKTIQFFGNNNNNNLYSLYNMLFLLTCCLFAALYKPPVQALLNGG